jgi:hypothetical protein
MAQEKWVLYEYTSFWNEIPSLRYSTPARKKAYTLYFIGKIRYHCFEKIKFGIVIHNFYE